MENFEFKCHTCNEVHKGIPSFGWDYPIHYLYIPQEERESRCHLETDYCVIDDEDFFVRGCLEIPIIGLDEPLSFGVWVSLSEKSFSKYLELYESDGRENEGPFFGWLCTLIPGYSGDEDIKTMVHLRPYPTRPYIELEPTDYSLAVEQRNGITIERVKEITEMLLHLSEGEAD